MYRLAFLVVALSAHASTYGQLAVKPQTPTPEPLIREAFIPAGTDVFLSYPMDTKLDGKDIWLWKYHKRKLSLLGVTNVLGQQLSEEQVRTALKKPTIVLLSADGKPIHPYYLKIIKPETLVIVDRAPGAEPAKRPRLGKQLRDAPSPLKSGALTIDNLSLHLP